MAGYFGLSCTLLSLMHQSLSEHLQKLILLIIGDIGSSPTRPWAKPAQPCFYSFTFGDSWAGGLTQHPPASRRSIPIPSALLP